VEVAKAAHLRVTADPLPAGKEGHLQVSKVDPLLAILKTEVLLPAFKEGTLGNPVSRAVLPPDILWQDPLRRKEILAIYSTRDKIL
jgi:hypothetical protein